MNADAAAFNRQRADEIIGRRHGASTDAGYESARKKYKVWMQEFFPAGLTGEQDDPVARREIILPLNNDATISFLGVAERLKLNGERLVRIPENTPPLAVSTMTAMSSALSDLYKKQNMEMDPVLKNQISNFMKGLNHYSDYWRNDTILGYKRTINDLKENGQMNIFEGKRPISSRGFQLLAAVALRSTTNRLGSVYPHVFTILCWNLFARSCNVGNLMLQHISWEEDCLKITLPKHKGDQEGLRIYPKHVYANPLRPDICPVLSLALYVFSCLKSHRNGRDWRLFNGGSTEAKFSDWLKRILETEELVNADLGTLAEDLGTHSFRFD
jgi:hypothetical protein